MNFKSYHLWVIFKYLKNTLSVINNFFFKKTHTKGHGMKGEACEHMELNVASPQYNRRERNGGHTCFFSFCSSQLLHVDAVSSNNIKYPTRNPLSLILSPNPHTVFLTKFSFFFFLSLFSATQRRKKALHDIQSRVSLPVSAVYPLLFYNIYIYI